MISFTNVSLRRGTALLFEQSSFTIHRGNKVGLVGANGSGKSSLFRLILGQLETDLGSVDLPQELRIGHMAQEVPGSSERALDYVLAGDKQLQEVTRSLAAADEAGEYSRVAELHETLDSIDGYSAPARAEQLMAGLGFSSADSTRPLKDFSGGWRIRLNLAQTLMTPADLLLLDEPTNHLDLDAVIWLAEWLKAFDGTLLLISHDREFLDECVDHIANLQGQRIELFAGNYTDFERLRAARLAEQKSSFEKQQREVAHMQDFVRRFRAKATKARQAQSRLKALERMELIAPAHVDSPFSFEIQSSEKTSTPLLSLADACLGYETPVLSNVNLTLLPGDRIGLLGVNGAGKSTLIKSLKEELPLLSGSFTRGANLSTAYFSQHQLDELNLATSAMDHLTELGRKLGKIPSEQQIRDFLGGYNFHGDKVLDPVSRFSGGEKARLALALIAWTRPNLLLMDEPTNHLDMDMRQALTVALQTFAGAMVLVSHDRHLMMNTVDLFYLVGNGEVRPFDGDLADYRNRIFKPGRGELSAAGEIKSPQPAAGPAPRKQAPGKLVRQLRTRISTLDDRMARLHRKLGEVETRLTEPTLYETRDHPDLQGLLRDQMELKAQLETMEEEWLALSTELESLESQQT